MKTAYVLPALICILFHELVLKGNVESDFLQKCSIEIIKKTQKKLINNINYPSVDFDYSICNDSFQNSISLSVLESC
jgi:hypothetical protein